MAIVGRRQPSADVGVSDVVHPVKSEDDVDKTLVHRYFTYQGKPRRIYTTRRGHISMILLAAFYRLDPVTVLVDGERYDFDNASGFTSAKLDGGLDPQYPLVVTGVSLDKVYSTFDRRQCFSKSEDDIDKTLVFRHYTYQGKPRRIRTTRRAPVNMIQLAEFYRLDPVTVHIDGYHYDYNCASGFSGAELDGGLDPQYPHVVTGESLDKLSCNLL